MPRILYYSRENFKDSSEAVSLLNSAISKKNLVMITCRCQIDYHGRSRSILPEGDRLLIIKTNGAVLVHRPKGYSPVNWQPKTSSIIFEDNDDALVMKAVRDSPREVLIAKISRVYSIMVAEGLIDDARFIMYASEKEIKDVIEKNPEIIEKGLEIIGREEKIEEGIVDFLARDRQGTLVVIEVKDERAGIESGKQLLRYIHHYRKVKDKVRGILVAPSFSKQVIEFLERNNLEKKRLNIDKIIETIEKRTKEKEEGKSILDFL